MSHLVLTLGCHRSGTSLIANSLECLGAQLGPRAHWKGPDNPVSFGEDLDVLAIDEQILRTMGSAWDDPIPMWFGPEDHPFINAAPVLVPFLESRLKEFPLFGLKEPRLCRLLPVWKHALYNIECKVSIVHAIRHPAAVAESLKKRNGLPTEQSYALWLEYNRCALEYVDPAWPRVVVDYDTMMCIPGSEIMRMGRVLGLELDRVKTTQFVRNFVDDTLWHESEEDAQLPTEVAIMWKKLRQEAMR